jgi:hypothetical protein
MAHQVAEEDDVVVRELDVHLLRLVDQPAFEYLNVQIQNLNTL